MAMMKLGIGQEAFKEHRHVIIVFTDGNFSHSIYLMNLLQQWSWLLVCFLSFVLEKKSLKLLDETLLSMDEEDK